MCTAPLAFYKLNLYLGYQCIWSLKKKEIKKGEKKNERKRGKTVSAKMAPNKAFYKCDWSKINLIWVHLFPIEAFFCTYLVSKKIMRPYVTLFVIFSEIAQKTQETNKETKQRLKPKKVFMFVHTIWNTCRIPLILTHVFLVNFRLSLIQKPSGQKRPRVHPTRTTRVMESEDRDCLAMESMKPPKVNNYANVSIHVLK